MIRIRLIFFFIAILEFGCTVPAKKELEVWLEYEPALVTLSGEVVVLTKPGPPGFGETPDEDAIVDVPVLKLSTPINVRGQVGGGVNSDSFVDIHEVQLILGPCEHCFIRYLKKTVNVTGTLFEHQSGHHYTSVLLAVHEFAQNGDTCPP